MDYIDRDIIKALPPVAAFLLLYRRDGYWWIIDTNGHHAPERTGHTADWDLQTVLDQTRNRYPFRLVVADPIPRDD